MCDPDLAAQARAINSMVGGTAGLNGDVRPVVVVEMAGENAEECANIFLQHDYLLMSAHDPVSADGVTDDISDLWDVLAIPREKFAQFIGR